MANRYECFTSSEISALCTWDKAHKNPGKPFYTYIEERRKQRRAKKGFASQGSVATKWGNYFEPLAFQRYKQVSGLHLISYSNYQTDFKTSPLANHGGTPDFSSFDSSIAGSIKCPFTESAFIDLFDLCVEQDPELFKKENPDYFWQLLSDSIVLGAKECHLVPYMPYEDEVMDLVSDSEFYWLQNPPGLRRDTEFTDIKSWVFEPPKEDIAFLSERIEMANKELESPTKNKKSSILLAHHDETVNATIIEKG